MTERRTDPKHFSNSNGQSFISVFGGETVTIALLNENKTEIKRPNNTQSVKKNYFTYGNRIILRSVYTISNLLKSLYFSLKMGMRV